MRLAKWLIPVAFVGLSGPTSPPQLDTPRPTLNAAAPINVRQGIAQFRVPPHDDGQLVIIVSALGSSPGRFPVSIAIAERPAHTTWCVSPPLVEIRPYQPSPNSSPIADPLVTPVSATSRRPRAQRIFDVPLLNGRPVSNGGSVRVIARPAANGSRTVVYLDEAVGNDTRCFELAAAIVTLLESSIMPAGDRQVGPPADIDGDDRLAILLTPRLAHLQNGNTTVGGFVRAADFQPHLHRPHSNQADMIYLNTHLALGQGLVDVLSHEYRHVLAFSQRDALGRASEEDWLNEAMAHLAEPGPTNISHRVHEYLAEPSRYSLVVPDYYQAGLWRCDGVRGSTFLFLDWCRQQHDEQFVGQLLRSNKTGIANLVAVTGTSFPRLFRQWSLAMLHGHGPLRGSGPTMVPWKGAGTLRIQVAGTATAYIAPGHLSSGATVRIEAPADARLQVTVAIRRSTDWFQRPNTSAVP